MPERARLCELERESRELRMQAEFLGEAAAGPQRCGTDDQPRRVGSCQPAINRFLIGQSIVLGYARPC
jgi:hypothetical protein